MTPPSTGTRPLPAFAEPLGNPGLTLAAASAALLGELESSLAASQRALLARDVVSLDRATREQIRLRRALEILCAQKIVSAPELRGAQQRVLHLGRVQAALLVREQRWLTVLANLVAGPEASYASVGDQYVAPGVDGRPK